MKRHLRSRLSRSSILNMQTNLLAALLFIVPAALAWVPYLGYVVWLIPLFVFFSEKKSDFVRFCASQALSLSIIRLVCDVVFSSISATALKSMTIYKSIPQFTSFWGEMAAPGAAANTIGAIFAALLCLVSLATAVFAYQKQLLRLPLLGDIAEYMTNEFGKPEKKSANVYKQSDM